MKPRILLFLLFVFGAATTQGGQYSQDLFERALENMSTAPDYVLITAVDPEKHTKRTICTTVNLFFGALHREYGLDYTLADQKRAKAIALQQRDRVFTFTKKDALKNLADYETPEALSEVRKLFATKKDAELLDHKLIDSLTIVRGDLPYKEAGARHVAYRDAVAHALLERGIGCTMGDITDSLTPHK